MSGRGEGDGPSAPGVDARSAGGVVVCREGPDLRVAIMRSRYETWVFPKGGIEPPETPEEAARREVREETGIKGATLVLPLGSTEHEFHDDGRRLRKRTDWFLFEMSEASKLAGDPAEGVLDCGWFTAEQGLKLLTHADQRRLLRRAISHLAKMGRERRQRPGEMAANERCEAP